jgi:predicted TIM-barrel fold metal-dependent hydrolase
MPEITTTRYIIECVKRFPGRFGAVIWVDVEKPDAPDTLERLSKEEGVVGVRLHPTERSPGPDLLAIWRKAAELGHPVSCFARSAEHVADPEFQKIVEELPGMTLILEHLAGAYRPLSPESVTPPYNCLTTGIRLR